MTALRKAHAQRRADDGLDQRGVGREARQHLAGLRGLEEHRALLEHTAVDRVADVRRHAFAQPAHRIEARRREKPQRHGHREEGAEVLAQRHGLGALVGVDQAAVNQAAQGDRKSQRGDGCHHQKEGRQGDLDPVGAKKWAQARQRPGRALGLRYLGRRGIGSHPAILTIPCPYKGSLDNNCRGN
jgi:hypothetical protein